MTMDGQPPRDAGLRNIIDKLAEFVARNGPEFEAITKQKQQGNPKFDFLYGGEFSTYYQYRVAAEQAMLKQQGITGQLPAAGTQLYMQQTPPAGHYSQAPPQQQSQQVPPNVHENAKYNIQAAQQQQQQHLWQPTNPEAQASVKPTNGATLAMNLTAQIDALNMQQNTLREQIKQSEGNLSAQHTTLMTQKAKQIEEAMAAAQTAQLEQLANEQGIVLRDFDSVLQPIIESCTKDSISAGKNWILQHSTDSAKINVVLQYLLKKALVNGSTFQQKLHLIYLVNDILHHCMRKNINDLKNSLENVVIPMFCGADLIASSDQRVKLTKLLSLWESKAKFFDACVISKLQSPDSSMQEYKTNLQNTHNDIVTKHTQNTKATLENYQKQHQLFVQHATQQIAQLEQQKQQLEQKQKLMVQQQAPATANAQQPKAIPALMSQRIAMPTADIERLKAPSQQQQQPSQQQHEDSNATALYHQQAANNIYAATAYQQQQQQQQQQAPAHNPFADGRANNFFIPDMSKPPPGFPNPMMHGQMPAMLPQQQQPPPQFAQLPLNSHGLPAPPATADQNVDLATLNAALQVVLQMHQQHALDENHPSQQHLLQLQQQQELQQQQQLHQQQQQAQQQQQQQQPTAEAEPTTTKPAPVTEQPPVLAEAQIPTAPYYDLPAGLIVPLIRLEDYNYKPLDPSEIRVPAPAPQSERLTNALNAFYDAPSHDWPRDNEGWEKLGLYEYYKVKNAARKQKEEDIKNGTREKSRSPSPIVMLKKGNKRVYCSRSPTRSRSRSPLVKEKSRSRSKTRSPERTPPIHRNRGGGNGSNRKGRNRSPRHDRDTPSHTGRDNRAERNSNNNNAYNKDIRRVDRDRSPTPPSFFGSSFAKPNDFIEESNKGHQMLMKMGWAGSGTGLGSKNQGIDTPISGGEVRDRKDMYKGVGNNLNDPFESFRKNKGAAFVHRMRSRDEKS